MGAWLAAGGVQSFYHTAKAAAALIDLDGLGATDLLCPIEWDLPRLASAAGCVGADADAAVYDGDRGPPTTCYSAYGAAPPALAKTGHPARGLSRDRMDFTDLGNLGGGPSALRAAETVGTVELGAGPVLKWTLSLFASHHAVGVVAPGEDANGLCLVSNNQDHSLGARTATIVKPDLNLDPGGWILARIGRGRGGPQEL